MIHWFAGICPLMPPCAGGFRNIPREEGSAGNRTTGMVKKFCRMSDRRTEGSFPWRGGNRWKTRLLTGDGRHILNTIQDMVMILDDRQRVVWANCSLLKFLSLPEEDVIGRPCHHLLHGGSEHGSECPRARLGGGGKRESFEMDLPDRDLRVRVTVDPFLGENGTVVGQIAFVARRERGLREQEELGGRHLSLMKNVTRRRYRGLPGGS